MTKLYVGYDRFGVEGVNEEFIQFVFDVVITKLKLDPDSDAGIVITDDEKMRSLNKQYRNKDKTTNVLSFGYLETLGEGMPAEDKTYLGDIFMSYKLVESEARELGITPKDRFTHLFVHGLLHLAGQHHDNEKQAQKMEDMEDEIIALIADTE